MGLSERTTLRLLLVSVGFGVVSGLLEESGLVYGIFASLSSTEEYTLSWSSMAISYALVPLVFYLLGRRPLPGFRVRDGLVATFAGSFLGGALGETAVSLLYRSSVLLPPFPFVFLTNLNPALSFLFIAFSGLSLARLRRSWTAAAGATRLIPFAALAFGVLVKFFEGFLQLQVFSQRLDFTLLSFASFAIFLLSFPGGFLVFYYLGRRVSVRGRAFRAFGWLFLGLYVGGVIGTLLAVGLFGQASWTTPAGSSSISIDGIAYSNLPISLVTILGSLDPVGALPFLPFFAVTLPQVGRDADETDGEHMANAGDAATVF